MIWEHILIGHVRPEDSQINWDINLIYFAARFGILIVIGMDA
jgi:hypothetical protein